VGSPCECYNELFGVHKMLANYRVGTQLVASRLVLSYIELSSFVVGDRMLIHFPVIIN
jgi:hypothetical protein